MFAVAFGFLCGQELCATQEFHRDGPKLQLPFSVCPTDRGWQIEEGVLRPRRKRAAE